MSPSSGATGGIHPTRMNSSLGLASPRAIWGAGAPLTARVEEDLALEILTWYTAEDFEDADFSSMQPCTPGARNRTRAGKAYLRR